MAILYKNLITLLVDQESIMGNDISAAQGKLSFGRKIAYGLGDVGASCSNLMFASYFLVYCTNCLGIAASTASVILLAARVFDIVNDSWWGNWTDNKSNCEFGKYRKQMLTWIIPAIIFTCLMFSCPSGLAGSTVAVIWPQSCTSLGPSASAAGTALTPDFLRSLRQITRKEDPRRPGVPV